MSTSRINVLFFIPLVLSIGLWAQTTGTLSGTVNNAEGAPVANAAVTVTPAGGGAPQKVTTGNDGKFAITSLTPGAYTVTVEYAGYKRTSVQNIDLAGTRPGDIRVELQHGNTQETVELPARAILMQTDSGETSTALDIRTVSETPLFDRNHQQLVNLASGVTPPYTSVSPVLDPQQSRLWETNGLSSAANRRTLDGLENGEPFNGTAVYVTPLEAIQQVDILTSNYDAQSGRAAGTIFNPLTRTGTNGLHGSVFEFNANSAMAARNFFDPKGYPQAHFNINQTGASLGGPIKRDNAFFLMDFESSLNRSQMPTITTVPTADFRNGNFSGVQGLNLYNPASGLPTGMNRSLFTNNMIPANQISPVARAILPFIPLPNSSGFENNLAVNVPLRNDGYRGDIRLDHKIRETNIFARGSYSDYSTEQGSALGALGGSNGHLQSMNAMVGTTTNMSPSLTMDLRLGYTRYADKLNNALNTLSPAAFGFSDPNSALFRNSGFGNLGLPNIQINGMQSFGSVAGYPQYNTDNNWNLVNGWNKLIGRNNIHFGFDVYYIRSNGFQNFAAGPEGAFLFGPGATASPTGTGLGPNGSYANSFAAFLLGAPTESGRNLPAFTPAFSAWQGSAYLADTVKVSSRLALISAYGTTSSRRPPPGILTAHSCSIPIPISFRQWVRAELKIRAIWMRAGKTSLPGSGSPFVRWKEPWSAADTESTISRGH
jgi:Bacterial Ig-like domain (group 1).